MKKMILTCAMLLCILGISSCSEMLSEEKPSQANIEENIETPLEQECQAGPAEEKEQEDAVAGAVSYVLVASIHESMPEYRFVAKGIDEGEEDWSMGFVTGLEIYNENNELLLLMDFTYEELGYPVYHQMMDTMGLHVTDVNFDGYKDVIILNNFAGAHSNTWYDCWLWERETSSFVFSKSFTEICNPSLDYENERIHSRGGSGAAYWGGNIYQYIDGEFVLTNSLDTGWDGLVEKKLVDGTMEVVREISFGEQDEFEENVKREIEYYNNDPLWQLDHPHWYWVGGHEIDIWLEQ